jgi:hypothetical protein
MTWWEGNKREYGTDDRVVTPHGPGKIVDIESCDKKFNKVHWDSKEAVDWRYGVEHDVHPKGFLYPVLYYYSRELKKEE